MIVKTFFDNIDQIVNREYIKDYRNMVHPAREIRAKENVTHENVGTMWSVLVRLISVLFPDS